MLARSSAAEDRGRSIVILTQGERWYAVHTLPLQESRAAANLINQGFRTFLPRRQKTVRHARRLLTVEAAFFPRYLFIVMDPTRDQWRSVNGTFGVARMVMRGEQPQPVPWGIVEALQASCDEAGLFQHSLRLHVGNTVRMMGGPFSEQLGTIDQLDDEGRVRVLLDILGRKVPVATHSNGVLPLANA
jgi:transcription elongation factor/antiterminator RfaH